MPKGASEKPKSITISLDREAQQVLLNAAWGGNIRELEHTVEKAVILSESSVLNSNDFIVDIEKEYHINHHKISLEETERIRIIEAMENNKGNLNKTADELVMGNPSKMAGDLKATVLLSLLYKKV